MRGCSFIFTIFVLNQKQTTMGNLKGHQGDVQFKEVFAVPEGFKKSNDRNLAYGEVSGHVHVITGDVDICRGENAICAVVGDGGACVQHTLLDELTEEALGSTEVATIADHKPVALPRGIYVFSVQKRYDPYAKVYEKVID